MRDTTRKLFRRVFLFPVITGWGIFTGVGCAIYHFWLHAPLPEPFTFFKYFISLIYQFNGWTGFDVFFPKEYFSLFMRLFPAQNGLIALENFANFVYFIDYPQIYTLLPQICLIWAVLWGIYYCYEYYKMPKTKKFRNENYIRGTNLISAVDFCRKSQNVCKNPVAVVPTTAGKICISDEDFKTHQLIIGSTGTGKSQILMNQVDSLLQNRPDVRLIVLDRKMEFYERFSFTEADTLLHPEDTKSQGWDLFNEIDIELDEDGKFTEIPDDVNFIATTLFPPDQQEKGVWVDGPRVLFACALCWCIEHGKATTKDLAAFLARPLGDIIDAFMNEKANEFSKVIGVLSDDKKSKTAGSILTITNTKMQQFTGYKNKGDFSIRRWVRAGQGSLFISTAGGNEKVYEDLTKLFVELVSHEIQDFRNENQQDLQLLFVLDELGGTPRLNSLNYLLSQARSKGVGVIIANQSFEKLKEIYGRGDFAQMINCCKTRWLLQVPEAQEGEYASSLLGKTEMNRKSKNKNKSSGLFGGNTRTGNNETEQIVEVSPLLSSEFFALKPLECVCIQPGLLPEITLGKIKYSTAPVVNQGFERATKNLVSARNFSNGQSGQNSTTANTENNSNGKEIKLEVEKTESCESETDEQLSV